MIFTVINFDHEYSPTDSFVIFVLLFFYPFKQYYFQGCLTKRPCRRYIQISKSGSPKIASRAQTEPFQLSL